MSDTSTQKHLNLILNTDEIRARSQVSPQQLIFSDELKTDPSSLDQNWKESSQTNSVEYTICKLIF